MIYLTVFIFIHEGKEEIFNEYENQVLPLMEQYNGAIIYRIRPSMDSFIEQKEPTPYEIHFLSFESENDFSNYLNDESRKAFSHLKQAAIKTTFLVKGKKL